MHVQKNAADILWVVAVIGIQAALAISKRHSLASLRAFLLVQAIIGAALLAIAIIANPWHYFYSWIAGTVVHHGLCAFLMWDLYTVVRLRGLPTRQGIFPIALIGLASILSGFYYANDSYRIIQDSAYRLVMPLDHGLSFSVGCMMAALPFYAMHVSAVIPKHVNLVIAGLSIYAFSYAGLLGHAIKAHPKMLHHAADFVYFISLFLWSKSLVSKGPLVAAEYPLTS
jgi:hypothetical protein